MVKKTFYFKMYVFYEIAFNVKNPFTEMNFVHKAEKSLKLMALNYMLI